MPASGMSNRKEYNPENLREYYHVFRTKHYIKNRFYTLRTDNIMIVSKHFANAYPQSKMKRCREIRRQSIFP